MVFVYYLQKETPGLIRIALLQFLCVWLCECPAAVQKFLELNSPLLPFVCSIIRIIYAFVSNPST